ncbi:MAG: hypothetical protein KatS3mg109_1328 [Pirellulaceae bacterium]|nr:MAG: hypothetical protein KatS3mg109_1328 [Pirellulaceae bacterium]
MSWWGVPLGGEHDSRCHELRDKRSLVLLCGRCGAVDSAERYWNALRVASELVDGIGEVDLHEEAYNVYVERTGKDDGGDPSEDDYIEAFVRAVERAVG